MERTYEPLDNIAADDPVTCALYAKEKGLLDEPGWRQFNHIAKRQGKLLRMVNRAKLRSYQCAPRFKFGYQVPSNHEEAMHLDKKTSTPTGLMWKKRRELVFVSTRCSKTLGGIGNHLPDTSL